MGRDLDHAREVLRAALLQEALVDELQLHRAPHERDSAAGEDAQKQISPPPEGAGLHFAFCTTAHGAALSWPASHGDTSSMSLGGGVAIFSLVLATRSTNACGPRALLELQLAPFHFQIVPLVVETLQRHEQLARPMLRVDRTGGGTERDDPEHGNGDAQEFAADVTERCACAVTSRARRRAAWRCERAGLRAISSAAGRVLRPTILEARFRGRGNHRQSREIRGTRVCDCMNCFTARSSRE